MALAQAVLRTGKTALSRCSKGVRPALYPQINPYLHSGQADTLRIGSEVWHIPSTLSDALEGDRSCAPGSHPERRQAVRPRPVAGEVQCFFFAAWALNTSISISENSTSAGSSGHSLPSRVISMRRQAITILIAMPRFNRSAVR
jgi:hypothetical protein